MSTFHLHELMSAWWPFWRDEVCGRAGNLLRSIPGDTCGTLPTLHSVCFWFLLFPDLRTWFSVQDNAHFLLFPRLQFWCCQPWSLLPPLCPGYCVFSSCPGVFSDPLLLCWSWNRITYHVVFPATWRREARRLRISGSSGSPLFCHSARCLFCFPATAPDCFPMNTAIPFWRVMRIVGHPAWSLFWSRIRHSLYQLRLYPLDVCTAVAAISRMLVWLRRTAGSDISPIVWYGRMLSWSRSCWCTAVHPIHDNLAPIFCTP